MNVLDHNRPELNSCCGCGACVAACKQEALRLNLSNEGFWEPNLDRLLCNECSRCLNVCFKFLSESEPKTDFSTHEFYSAFSTKEDVVAGCSSGGVVYELGKYAIKKTNQVCGVIYDTKQDIAVTKIAKNYQGLDAFRGSKYLQSFTPAAISESLKEKNRNYLFVGTPCQVYGMRKLVELNKQASRYIFIDFFCHGVPSYLIWQAYLKEIKKSFRNDKIISVNFRSKKFGWHTFCFEFKSKTKTYYQNVFKSSFYKIFLDDVILARSCYTCKICKRYGFSDIRVGDYWGAKYDENEKGVSIFSLANEKGKNLINSISDQIYLEKENLSENSSFLQDSNNYSLNENVRNIIVSGIYQGKTLSQIIKEYSVFLPIKYRIKKGLASIVSNFSPWLVAKIRKSYHRLK